MTFRGFIAMLTVPAAFLTPVANAQEVDSPPANFVEDVSNAGTSAAAFLQIGVGARADLLSY